MSGCLSPVSGSVVFLNWCTFKACGFVSALSSSDLRKLGLPACTGCRQCLGVSCTQDSGVFFQKIYQYVALYVRKNLKWINLHTESLGLPTHAQVADIVWVSLAPKTPVLAFAWAAFLHSTWPSLPNKQSAGYFRQFATETPLACTPHPVATKSI